MSGRDWLTLGSALLLVALIFAALFTRPASANSIVETRREHLVFSHSNCRVYELTISDKSGTRRLYITTPTKDGQYPGCRVTK